MKSVEERVREIYLGAEHLIPCAIYHCPRLDCNCGIEGRRIKAAIEQTARECAEIADGLSSYRIRQAFGIEDKS